MSERISRDQLFMGIAELHAQRSTCLRGHTGAVIVKDKRVVSAGYNGSPPNLPQCTEYGCESIYSLSIGESAPILLIDDAGDAHKQSLRDHGCQRTIHAELNAIAWAARAGIGVEGATMYMLSQPCLRCAQAVIAAGIEELVWRDTYWNARMDLLDKAFMKVRQFGV